MHRVVSVSAAAVIRNRYEDSEVSITWDIVRPKAQDNEGTIAPLQGDMPRNIKHGSILFIKHDVVQHKWNFHTLRELIELA